MLSVLESRQGRVRTRPWCAVKHMLLEIELHRKLDEPRIASSLQLSELRCSDFNGNRLYLACRSDRAPERVYVVPEIEEVRAELDPHLLANGKRLQHRQIPNLITGTVRDVSPFISKRTLNEIAGKCAGIEERSWHTGFAIGIPDDIGSGRVKSDRATTIRI